MEYRRNQKQLRETPVLPDSLTANTSEAHALLQQAIDDGATTLDGLEAKLAEKATAAGATGYSITSAIGKDKMSGTAVIYK